MNDDRKVCIITGGGKGIGASITRVFHEAGYRVLIGSRSDSGLARELGEGVVFERIDVKREEGHRNLVKKALSLWGCLDVYINNAGYSSWRPVSLVDEAFFADMMETNVNGTYWGCKAAAETLSSDGVIINVSSLAGKRGSAHNSVYCASKFAVNGITQALAKELGPRGIRVNAVCPVYVRTEGLLEALEDEYSPAAGGDVAEYLDAFTRSNTALHRLPLGDEVGKACLYLASDGSSAITGQCINVDCGVLPQ